MSTRSAIAIKKGSGYDWIYCHHDGYLEGVGNDLKRHYSNKKDVEGLLDLGDISSLESTVEKTKKESYKHCGVRFESEVEKKHSSDLDDLVSDTDDMGCEYVYIMDNNNWSYIKVRDGMNSMKKLASDITKKFVAQEILKIANDVLSYKIDTKYEGNVNEVFLKSWPEEAPRLATALKNIIIKEESSANRNYHIKSNDLKRVWSEYYGFSSLDDNSNKYHYYGIYSFKDENGETKYAGANCSGRIGTVQRAFDLTKKFSGGAVDSMSEAMDDIQKHLKAKVRPSKGYEKINFSSNSPVASKKEEIAEDMPKPHYVDPRLVKRDEKHIGQYSTDSAKETEGMEYDVFHSGKTDAEQVPSEEESIEKMNASVAREIVKLAKMIMSDKTGTFECPDCGTKVLENTGYCLKCKKKVSK